MGMKRHKTGKKIDNTGDRQVRVGLSPNAMLRVLTLAASAADNDADKRHVLTVAEMADDFMRQCGERFHVKHPMIGDVDSFRALVEGIMTWVKDFAFAKAGNADARNLEKAQELIDAVSEKKSAAKK
jgi:hypothetical protein